MKILSLLFFCAYIVMCYGDEDKGKFLKTRYEWKYIEFDWESDDQKKQMTDAGNYEPTASIPLDIDLGFDETVFVTIARKKGVPATLGVVTSRKAAGGPIVKPYPDWETNQNMNCDGLINAKRIVVNKCNQLWVLDTGIVDDNSICDAKLMIYDLTNNTLVNIMKISSELYSGSLDTMVIHDSSLNCNNPTVIIANPSDSALIVYGGKDFCSYQAPEFKVLTKANLPEDLRKVSTDKDLYVMNLAITERTDHNLEESEAILYFMAVSSSTLHWMTVNSVRNYCETSQAPVVEKFDYDTKMYSAAFTIANRILFFGALYSSTLNCYNTLKELDADNTVELVQDRDRLQWISSMKSYPKTLQWANQILLLSNQFGIVSGYDKPNTDEVNYRILNANADEITYTTNCY